ncbi:uncharacterized protein [Lepeophtheirus salmonis]|uniref:uncharacterized protein isoform X2 n=1 Tax=Lepeophtheirus salmonis TaxID=72036 RepID=UPI003AF3C9E6
MTADDEFDYLYGDLEIHESEKEKELREANERLLLENTELKDKLGVLWRRHNERLEQTRILTRNLSSLIKTARSEVSRKNSTISDLKKKYEDLVFKRSAPGDAAPLILDPKDLTPKLCIPPKLKPYKNGDLECCPEVRDLFLDASKGFHRVSCGQNSVTFIRHESIPESGNNDIVYLRLDDGTLIGKKSLPSKVPGGKMFVMTPSKYKSLKRKRNAESNSLPNNKLIKSEEPKRDNLLEKKDVKNNDQRSSSTRNSKHSSYSSRYDKYHDSKRYDSKKNSYRDERHSRDKRRVSPDSSSRRGTILKEKSPSGHNISSKVPSDQPLSESNRYSDSKSDTHKRKQSFQHRKNVDIQSSRDSKSNHSRQSSSSSSKSNSVKESIKSFEKSSENVQKNSCSLQDKKLFDSVKETKIPSNNKCNNEVEKVEAHDFNTPESTAPQNSISTNKIDKTPLSSQCNSQSHFDVNPDAFSNNRLDENKFIDHGSEKSTVLSLQTTSTDNASCSINERIHSGDNLISDVDKVLCSRKMINLKSDCLVDINNDSCRKLQKLALKEPIQKNDKNNSLKNSLYVLKKKKEECKVGDSIAEPTTKELSDTDYASKVSVDELSEPPEIETQMYHEGIIPEEWPAIRIDANSTLKIKTEASLNKVENEVKNTNKECVNNKFHSKESFIPRAKEVSRAKELKYDINNSVDYHESRIKSSKELGNPSKTKKGVVSSTSAFNQPKNSSTDVSMESVSVENSSQDHAENTNCKSNLNVIMKCGKENISTNKLKMSTSETNNFNEVSVRDALLADLELSDSDDESALDIIFNTADAVKSERISSKTFSSQYSSMDRYTNVSENKKNHIRQTNSILIPSDNSSSDVDSHKKPKQLSANKLSREKLNALLFDDSELSDPSENNSYSKDINTSSDNIHVNLNKSDLSNQDVNTPSKNKSSIRDVVSDRDDSSQVDEYLFQNYEMFNTPERDDSSTRTLKRINTEELENMITSRQSLMNQLIEEEKICKEKLSQVYMISPVKYCQDNKVSFREPGELSSSDSEEELTPAYSTPMSKIPATPKNSNVNFNSTAGIASILRGIKLFMILLEQHILAQVRVSYQHLLLELLVLAEKENR